MGIIKAGIVGTVLTVKVDGMPEAIVVDADSLPESVRAYAIMHGIKQRVCDAAALSRDADNGKSATPAEKHAAMLEVAQGLLTAWELPRTGGQGATGGDLYRAMREAFPKSANVADAKAFAAYVEAAAKKLSVTQPAIRTKLAEQPQVKAILDRLAAERAKGVDAEKLMEGFVS